MKGLLLKDWYMAKKYCRTYLWIVILFMGASLVGDGNMFYVFYPCMIAGMLPVTLLGYDERSKWNVYCGTLPYKKTQIVSAKYLMGLFMQLFIFIVTGVIQAVRMLRNGMFVWNDYLVIMLLLLIMSCITSSVTLPFMFRLGVEKGRMAYYVMIGIVCGGSALASGLFDEKLQTTIEMNALLLILCVAGVAVYGLSWYLSIIFYKKYNMGNR